MKSFQEMLSDHQLNLDPQMIDRILAFGEMVVRYNKKANLISSGDEAKIQSRHLLDSLQPMRIRELIPSFGASWCDMGSGAGFPVVPLSIANPSVNFFAVEPRLKRSTFLKVVAKEIGILNLTVIENDAESCGLQNLDRVSCRALGSAEDDWKRAESLLKESGVFITLKSLNDCSSLPIEIWTNFPYSLPSESQQYCVLSRKKVHG